MKQPLFTYNWARREKNISLGKEQLLFNYKAVVTERDSAVVKDKKNIEM